MSKATWFGLVILAVACGGTQAPPPLQPVKPADGITATSTTLGPITSKTLANLAALRAALAGYDVHPVNDNGLEFDVYKNGEKLFYVIPDDSGGVFNAHLVSARIAIEGHPWKVGSPFTNAGALTQCDCWGKQPVCFTKGEHVAVAFSRACGNLGDAHARRVLEGVPIQRVIWVPRAFGIEPDAGYGGHDYGSGSDEPPDEPDDLP
jgi:hypothetical protein